MMPIGQFICDGHLDGGGAVDRETTNVVGCFTKFCFMEHIKLGLSKNCFYKIISNLLIPTHWISFFLYKMTSWSHIWREKELGKFMTKYSLTLVKFPHIDNLEIGNAFIAIVSFNPLLAQQKQTCKKIMQPVKLEIQTESNHLCNWQQFCSQNSRTSIALFCFHAKNDLVNENIRQMMIQLLFCIRSQK